MKYIHQITENTLIGSEIFKVNATDDDAGPHGEVTYKIIGGGKIIVPLLLFFF